jgi:hypothetical protein
MSQFKNLVELLSIHEMWIKYLKVNKKCSCSGLRFINVTSGGIFFKQKPTMIEGKVGSNTSSRPKYCWELRADMF